jgi:uncharacterized protein (DUF1800 family)
MKRRDFITTAGAAASAAVLARSRATAAPTNGPGGGPAGDQPKAQTVHQKALAERNGSLKGLPEPYKLPKLTSKGLTEYVPSAEMPWDKQRAGYLLRRTMFGNNTSDLELALQKSPSEAVDMLLADNPAPALPASWINENYTYTTDGSRDRNRFNEFIYWWLDLMANQDISIREKMVWFWHDHWATERASVRQPQFNYWFIDMFRRNPLGNFKQMVKDVTLAPAMLIYLDGWSNTRTRPNENYARELMELHTLGEGNGYTEHDIVEASRALTGWTMQNYGGTGRDIEWDPKDPIFIQNRYDNTDKTFMGRTGNWGSLDIVDIIFEERANEAAHYICRKLYREFVYELADEDIVDELSQLLIQSDWEIKPVLAKLLKSEHFFDSVNFGAHISSPLEHYIGAIRTFDIPDPNYAYVHKACTNMGLELLAAPNVKGWPSYRTWISATRLALRWIYTDEIVNGSMRTSPKYSIDAVAFAKQFEGWTDDPRLLTENITGHVIELNLNDAQIDLLLTELLGGAPEYEWYGIPEATRKIKLEYLLKKLLRAGEYQII